MAVVSVLYVLQVNVLLNHVAKVGYISSVNCNVYAGNSSSLVSSDSPHNSLLLDIRPVIIYINHLLLN